MYFYKNKKSVVVQLIAKNYRFLFIDFASYAVRLKVPTRNALALGSDAAVRNAAKKRGISAGVSHNPL